MNIFYLSDCPIEAAQSQCDKHVVKMILESAQMLCTAHHSHPTDATRPEKFYKQTHTNHPSNKWVRGCTENYNWLCLHAMALCSEYTYRYGKIHASEPIIWWCLNNIPNIPVLPITKMPQCMPDEFKTDCSIEAYRSFYNIDKRQSFKCVWTKRNEPKWWSEHLCLEA